MNHAAWSCALWLMSWTGCTVVQMPREDPRDKLVTAGVATVFDVTRDAFSLPMPLLTKSERTQFFLGNSFFNQNWVTAPASTAERDGLGPLFNARSCSTCHFKDGRGSAPETAAAMETMLLRISVPGRAEHGGPLPHPIYGEQIQPVAVPGASGEARVIVDYTEHVGAYADGEAYRLRAPQPRLVDLAYGDISQPLLVSARVPPALVGLGLLEAVPDATLLSREDPDDRDHDGISGRSNRVWNNTTHSSQLGRFGWKAEQPDVRQQTAGAFVGDMGITSRLLPAGNCTAAQTACEHLPSGGSPEIDDATLESVVRYIRTLAVPARRELAAGTATRGASLFHAAHCDGCHVDTLLTGPVAQVSGLTTVAIHPYTDLLLHDLGEGLADHRPAFDADGSEFRTAPLWGLGLVRKVNGHSTFLHDGRARDLTEAVLWHGGEAEVSQRTFVMMQKKDREALIAFVDSL